MSEDTIIFVDLKNTDGVNTPFILNKVNTIITYDGTKDIYKYETKNPEYITFLNIPVQTEEVTRNYNNIAVIAYKKLYVVHLKGRNTPELKDKVRINPSYLEKIKSGSDDVYQHIHEEITEPNEMYLVGIDTKTYFEQPEFHPLDTTQEIIASLNEQIMETCPDYKIILDYVYNARYKDVKFYDKRTHVMNFILCLMDKTDNSCISSITFYLKNLETDDTLYFDSFTVETHQKRNMNKLLRGIAILIAPHLSKNIQYIASPAVNPVSAYTMMKHFNAIPEKKYVEYIENKYKKRWIKKSIDYMDLKNITKFMKKNHFFILILIYLI